MPGIDPNPTGTAYHEVGHAVIAHRVGFRTNFIELLDKPNGRARGRHTTVENREKLTQNTTQEARNVGINRVILLKQAGPRAERLLAKSASFLPEFECDAVAVAGLLLQRIGGGAKK
jgi:hypothetical protein